MAPNQIPLHITNIGCILYPLLSFFPSFLLSSLFKRYVADTVAPQIRRCDIDGVTRPPELVPETLRWMAGVYLAQAQQVRVAETIVKEENAYITTKGT